MAHNETPGYGVGTPWLGAPGLVSPGPDEYLGSRAGEPGTGTVAAAHGPDEYLGRSWGGAGAYPTGDAGEVAADLSRIGDLKTSERRANGLGVHDYV